MRAIHALCWVGLFLIFMSSIENAHACSVCLSSDSTYTLLGQEADHPERLRISDENLFIQKSQGEEFHSEVRSYLGLSYGITDRVTFAATLPWVWKGLQEGDESTYTRGVGDAEFLARASLWQNRPLGATDVLRVSGGAQLPTGNYWIREPANHGAPLVDEHSQIGSGAFAAVAGIDYQHFGEKYGVGGGLLGRVNGRSPRGYRYGSSVLASASYFYQDRQWFMVGIGPLYRFAARDKINGAPDPDSGGGILYIEPSVTVRAKNWFSVRGKVAQPVATHLFGEQREYPVYSFSIASDLPL